MIIWESRIKFCNNNHKNCYITENIIVLWDDIRQKSLYLQRKTNLITYEIL